MKSILLLCSAFLLCISASAQNQTTVNAQSNTIFVSADGKYEAEPDTAQLQFYIWAQEKEAKQAYAKASQEVEQLRQILRSNGVDPKLANLGFFSLTPVYDYRTPQRKIVGYRVSTYVTLKLKEMSKAGDIVGTIGDQEWAENVNLTYTLEDTEAAKVKAVDDAFHRAQTEAAAVARAGGRELGPLSYASVDTFEQVRPMAAREFQTLQKAGVAQASPTEDFSPQTVTVTARVSTMFSLK